MNERNDRYMKIETKAGKEFQKSRIFYKIRGADKAKKARSMAGTYEPIRKGETAQEGRKADKKK